MKRRTHDKKIQQTKRSNQGIYGNQKGSSDCRFLQGRTDHPTADTVYTNIREIYPNISLGTVYRNLTLLADMGEILRINVGDGTVHFDPDTSVHYHFICKGCGCVQDIELEKPILMSELVSKAFDGEITDTQKFAEEADALLGNQKNEVDYYNNLVYYKKTCYLRISLAQKSPEVNIKLEYLNKEYKIAAVIGFSALLSVLS